MHKKNIHKAGRSIAVAEKVLIMMHGRGASAHDILGLAPHLNVAEFALIAPQATNSTWYPFTFLAPVEQNQPWLDSALNLLHELVQDVKEQGIFYENIYLIGFSQGACLALEYASRNATRYGGIAAFTGGLIGDTIDQSNYQGDFNQTPVFISTGNPDPHVPLERVNETVNILTKLNAQVNLHVYEGKPHNISQDEIDLANRLIFKI